MNKMKISILGISLDQGTFAETLQKCEVWLREVIAMPHQIVTVNPEFVMEAQKNERFLKVLSSADLRITDGVGLVFGSLFLYGWGNRLHRCTGVDVTWGLAELCFRNKKTIYLVGASDGIAKGVAIRAAAVLEKKFPGIIVGAEDGLSRASQYEDDDIQTSALCDRMRAVQPDIVLIAVGAPKQDIWIAGHMHSVPSVRIALGIGGTLDYIAGVVPRAPRAFRKLGFEWLYRLVHQPHRISRIITATIHYPLAVLRQKFF